MVSSCLVRWIHIFLSLFRRLEYLGMWSGSSKWFDWHSASVVIVSVPNCVRAKLDDRNALGTADLSFVFDEEAIQVSHDLNMPIQFRIGALTRLS